MGKTTLRFKDIKEDIDYNLNKLNTLFNELILKPIKENEDAFTGLDLKCHEVASLDDKDFEKYNLSLSKDDIQFYFESWCNIEYYFFTKAVQEKTGFDFEKEVADFIGRTSTFYLFFRWDYDKKFFPVDDICPDFCSADGIYFDHEKKEFFCCIDDNEIIEDDDIKKYFYEYDNIICNLNEAKLIIDTTIKIYKMIADFKENQVENFIDFVKNEVA